MERIPVTLSPDQLYEIQNLIRFRKDSSSVCPFSQGYDEFLSHLSSTLEVAEIEFFANGYCTDDSEVTA